jgi:polyisoprenyl-teichoic acid--peptidoglycan teichoic acid transferase
MTTVHALPRRLGRTGALALAVLVLLAGNALAVVQHRADLRPAYAKDGLLVILVIGSDIGPPHRPGDPQRGRADGLHLIAVDTQQRRATILDFPRDSLVGGTKVNAYLATGGPDRLVAAVQSFTGIPIDFWALTSFKGLEGLVEGMGGVAVDVPHRVTSAEAGARLEAGPQVLAGWQALAFTRDRKSQPGGDFDRTRNQGLLMRAAHAQLVGSQADLPSITRFVAVFLRNTATNIPRNEVLPMGLLAASIDPANVLQVPLGGSVGSAGGASVVRLAPGDAFDRIRAGVVGP